MLGPSVKFGEVDEFKQTYQDPNAPTFHYYSMTAKVTEAVKQELWKRRGTGGVYAEPLHGRCTLPIQAMPAKSTRQQTLEAAKKAAPRARGIIRVPRSGELGFAIKHVNSQEAKEAVTLITRREACDTHCAKLVGLSPHSPGVRIYTVSGWPSLFPHGQVGHYLWNCHSWNAITYGPIRKNSQAWYV